MTATYLSKFHNMYSESALVCDFQLVCIATADCLGFGFKVPKIPATPA